MASLFERLDKESPSELTKRSEESLDWFRQNLRDLRINKTTALEAGDATDTTKGTQVMGNMYMFGYDAKYQDVLPYWDAFPLVIVTDYTPKGFQGLNLHYLSPRDRVRLLDGLYELVRDDELNGESRFNFKWNDIRGITKLRFAKPCLKNYLFSHTVGDMKRVQPQYWDMVAMLPTQRFTINANTVYAESRRMY